MGRLASALLVQQRHLLRKSSRKAPNVLHLQGVESFTSQLRDQMEPDYALVATASGRLEVGYVGTQPVREILAKPPRPLRERDASLRAGLEFNQLMVRLQIQSVVIQERSHSGVRFVGPVVFGR